MTDDEKQFFESLLVRQTDRYIGLLEEHKRTTDAKFDAFRDEFLARLDRQREASDRKFEQVFGRFDGLETRVDGLETKVDQNTQRLERLETKVDQNTQRLHELDETTRGLGVLIEEVRHEVQIVAEGHLAFDEKMDRRFDDVDREIARLRALEQRVEALERAAS